MFSKPFEINDPNIQVKESPNSTNLSFTITVLKSPERPVVFKMRTITDAIHFKCNVIVNKDVKVTIIEDWTNIINSPSVKFDLNVQIKSNSTCDWILLQHTSTDTNLVFNRHISIDDNAHANLYHFHFGALTLSETISQHSAGVKASMNTSIVSKAINTQSFNFNCTHHSSHLHSDSSIDMRCINLDKSKLSIYGDLDLNPGSTKAVSKLSQKVLNLSNNTSITTLPALHIDTNDVEASHSCTIHNLDPNDKFYLHSRGLSLTETTKLLMNGFIKTKIDELKEIPHIQKSIISYL